MLETFANAYITTGEVGYRTIRNILSGYSQLVELSGAETYQAATAAYDFVALNAPKISLPARTPAVASAVAPPARMVVASSTTPRAATLAQTISNSYPTYTTVVQGVSSSTLNSSLLALRGDILGTVAGMLQPVAAQGVTNMNSIQQVNMIQDLSNLVVRNGDFRGGTFSNGSLTSGISVSATTGSFTNLTSGSFSAGSASLATTTVTGGLSLGSLNGPLQANNGAVSATTSIGVLYGGTGWTNIQSNTILLGNGTGALATTSAGTAGYVLAYLNGIPTWTATSSINNGVTAVTGTYPVQSSGGTTPALSLAFGTTTGNTWGGTQTFTNAPTLATFSGLIAGNSGATYQVSTTSMNASITGQSGSVANSITFNNGGAGAASGSTFNGGSALTVSYNTIGAQVAGSYESPLTFNTPMMRSANTIAWVGLATTSQPASSNLLVSNGTSGVYGAATSSPTFNGGLTTFGTAGALVGGSSFTVSLANVNGNSLLGCAGSSACTPTSVATSSLFQNASANTSGLLTNTDWSTFNNKVSTTRAVNTTYPLQGGGDLSADRTLSLAFGTTTSNTWGGTQSFTNAPTLATFSGLVAGNSGATYQVSTTSMNASITGNAGSVTNGVYTTDTGTVSTTMLANSAVTYAKLQNLNYGDIIGRNAAGAGVSTGLSTSTYKSMLALTSSDVGLGNVANAAQVTSVTGTWPIISSGGTTPNLTWGGLSTSTAAVTGNIPYFSGANTFANVATTTLTLSGFPANIPSGYGKLVGGSDTTFTWWGLATTSQPSSSNLLVSNGTSGVYGVGTTSATCSTGVSCTGFNVLGGSNPSFALAALGSAGVLGAPTATTPTVQATSTLYGASTGGMVLGWNNSTNGIGWVATSTGGGTNYWTLSGSNLYNNSGTNIGIGTTSPFSLLSLAGAAGGATNLFAISTSTAGYATTTALTIDSNGKLSLLNGASLSVSGTAAISGTGTTTLAGFIDVNGTGTNATSTFASNLWVKGTLRTGTGSMYLNDSGLTSSDGNIALSRTATSTLGTNGLAVGTSQFVVQQTSGSVGIGTANPGYTLDVTGNIRASSQVRAEVANGTAPLVVNSTTKVANLNADLLDGLDSSAFGDATAANQTTILSRIGTNADATTTPSAASSIFSGMKFLAQRQYKMQTFTSSGTWTWPGSHVSTVLVTITGGGGGGGGNTAKGGGGGGAGQTYVRYPVSVSANVTVTVGSGGSGGAAANAGNNGMNTSFGSLSVNGGRGGNPGGTSNSGGNSGGGVIGGTASGGVGTVCGNGILSSSGGSGGGGGVNGGAAGGTGGVCGFGGGAGVALAGAGGGGSAFGTGGNGGGSNVPSDCSGGSGTNGATSAGGGGGGWITGTGNGCPGGGGGDGLVIVEWFE